MASKRELAAKVDELEAAREALRAREGTLKELKAASADVFQILRQEEQKAAACEREARALADENARLKREAKRESDLHRIQVDAMQKEWAAQRSQPEPYVATPQATPQADGGGLATHGPGAEASAGGKAEGSAKGKEKAKPGHQRRNSAPAAVIEAFADDRLHIIRTLRAQTLKARHYKARVMQLEREVSLLHTKHATEMQRLQSELKPTVDVLDQLSLVSGHSQIHSSVGATSRHEGRGSVGATRRSGRRQGKREKAPETMPSTRSRDAKVVWR